MPLRWPANKVKNKSGSRTRLAAGRIYREAGKKRRLTSALCVAEHIDQLKIGVCQDSDEGHAKGSALFFPLAPGAVQQVF
jgi:hypothetical protein